MSTEQLLNVFRGLIESHHLTICINEPHEFKEPTSLDIEHDEYGNFVCCGMYEGITNTVWYYNDLRCLRSVDFSTASLICHNGVSDFDCLRSWGIELGNKQLYWDTQLVAHIIDSSRHNYGLKYLADGDLDIRYPSYDDIVGKRTLKQIKERKTLDKQPEELVRLYNSCDCLVTYKLYELQKKKIFIKV